MKIRRKWFSLPLLLVYPFFIIAMIATIFIFIFSPSDQEPIYIGLIDQDQSQETQMVVELIETTSQFGDVIKITPMNEEEAIRGIEENQLSSYIIFPKDFTNDLYTGVSVNLNIIGNPNQPVKSHLVKELIDSLTRHISTSQANILTINYYAKELGIDQSTRRDILFEQFKEFLFYTLGKDNILNEEKLENIVTTSPLHYYALASWFIINSIWLLLLYSFFYQEETTRMRHRMMLYGVTKLQQIIARVVISVIIGFLLMAVSFSGLNYLLNMELVWDDYTKIGSIMLLYSVQFLFALALIELLIPSQKLRLLLQILMTICLLLISGVVIPTIYFPLSVQYISSYLFSYQAFYWLNEILFHERIFVDYLPLILTALISLFALIGVSLWKEKNR